MKYYSCLLCEETAKRVAAIEEHLEDRHDVVSNASGRWELVEGDPDDPPRKVTFLGDFA